jgi:phage terminase large subunit-like protein
LPRINRRVRVRPQNRVTRAQILELLIGPNGASVCASETDAAALWTTLQTQYSPAFAASWYAAGNASKRFAEIAAEYARGVVAGEISACRWTQLACARHLRDLERAEAGKWAFRFDVAKAERACRFLELLPHVKGGWAATAELMVLQPWQIFIVCSLFGWLKRESGMRRFSMSYIEVPRKNGKSFLAAGIGLYLCFCDAEHGAEVYSGATTEKQAHEVFLPARQMMERSPELAQALGVVPATKRIGRPEDGSRFEVVIGKPGDGASPHCGIVDEYHEHDSDALFDTLRTGMGARRQPLVFVITTAGDNTAGPCKLLQGDVCKILEGAFERDEVFGIIYSIDPGDSWTAVESLAKANPNLDVSVFREFLVAEQQAAIVNARKQGVFQTKHLDVWVGSVASYFDVRLWKALADPSLRPEMFIGQPCVIAGDLSTKRDFTARVAMFRKERGGKEHYFVFSRFYLPQAQVDRPESPHYKEWKKNLWLIAHDGGTVDFDIITEETIDEVKRFEAIEFAYDPWNAASLAQAVGKKTSATIVEMPQNPRVLSPPMKELDAAIAEGRIHHDGNPVLTWMIGNVKAREDVNENVLPRKEDGRAENKIDGAVAVIMALARIQAAQEETISYTGLRSVAC